MGSPSETTLPETSYPATVMTCSISFSSALMTIGKEDLEKSRSAREASITYSPGKIEVNEYRPTSSVVAVLIFMVEED